ncbi:MAG: type II toxin-antitoxin system VapC family toxin [Thermocrispum sp.]
MDTSALIAIAKVESDASSIARALAAVERPRMSAAGFAEAGIVIDGNRDPVMSRRFDELLKESGIEIAPLTVRQATIARQAYRDFGKGSGHPAGLNFGDCFAYALASESCEPLLFKGEGFVHTDITPAL